MPNAIKLPGEGLDWKEFLRRTGQREGEGRERRLARLSWFVMGTAVRVSIVGQGK